MQLKKIYQQCESLSDQIFHILQFWTPFVKQIVGIPFQTSIDKACITLIKAYQSKSKRKFLLEIAYEDLTETLVWLDKARRRKLVLRKDYQRLYKNLNSLQDKIFPSPTEAKKTYTKPKTKK